MPREGTAECKAGCEFLEGSGEEARLLAAALGESGPCGQPWGTASGLGCRLHQAALGPLAGAGCVVPAPGKCICLKPCASAKTVLILGQDPGGGVRSRASVGNRLVQRAVPTSGCTWQLFLTLCQNDFYERKCFWSLESGR